MKITIIQNTIDKKPQKHENYNYSEALWLTIKKIIKLDITNKTQALILTYFTLKRGCMDGFPDNFSLIVNTINS